jgi:tRNA G18 (ribose-2'-O)-methylase SpoU
MTKNTEQAVNIFAEKVVQSFEKRLNALSKGIDAYQSQLIASLKEMNTSDNNNVVMEEISKSQNQLTKEIRSLYKKNEEIIRKIKSSDGLIKFP